MPLIYKNAEGKVLNKREVKAAKAGQLDYQVTDTNNKIGIYEARGLRPTQQDRVIFDTLKNFALPFEKQEELLKETFAILQQQQQNTPDEGSTAICSIISDTKITTASLGDSLAYLFIFDENGNLVRNERLNKILHNPDDPNEAKRIEETAKKNRVAGRQLRNGKYRLGDSLAVSRSLGDIVSEPFGLIHDPDIYETTYRIRENCTGLLIYLCDGPLEKMSEQEFFEFVKANQHLKADELGRAIVEKGIEKGSEDNCSVIVKPLFPNTDKQNKDKEIIGIFDGHGGSSVSQFLSDNFIKVFKRLIPTKRSSPNYRNIASLSVDQRAAWVLKAPKETLKQMFQTSFRKKIFGHISAFFGFPKLTNFLSDASGDDITKIAINRPEPEVLESIFKERNSFFSGIDFCRKLELNNLFDLTLANQPEINSYLIKDPDFLASIGSTTDSILADIKSRSEMVQGLTKHNLELEKNLYKLEEKLRNIEDYNQWLIIRNQFGDISEWVIEEEKRLKENDQNITNNFPQFKETLLQTIASYKNKEYEELNKSDKEARSLYSRIVQTKGYLKALKIIENETVYNKLIQDKHIKNPQIADCLLDILSFADVYLIKDLLIENTFYEKHIKEALRAPKNLDKISAILFNILRKRNTTTINSVNVVFKTLLSVNRDALLDVLFQDKRLLNLLKEKDALDYISESIPTYLVDKLSIDSQLLNEGLSDKKVALLVKAFRHFTPKQQIELYIELMKHEVCAKDERIKKLFSSQQFLKAYQEHAKRNPSYLINLLKAKGLFFVENLFNQHSLTVEERKNLVQGVSSVLNKFSSDSLAEIVDILKTHLDAIKSDSILLQACLTQPTVNEEAPFIRFLKKNAKNIMAHEEIIFKSINKDPANVFLPVMITLWNLVETKEMGESKEALAKWISLLEGQILEGNTTELLLSLNLDSWQTCSASKETKERCFNFVAHILQSKLDNKDKELFIKNNVQNKDLMNFLGKELSSDSDLIKVIEGAESNRKTIEMQRARGGTSFFNNRPESVLQPVIDNPLDLKA